MTNSVERQQQFRLSVGPEHDPYPRCVEAGVSEVAELSRSLNDLMTEVVASFSAIVLGVYMKGKLGRIRPDLMFKLSGNMPKSARGNVPQEHRGFFCLFPLKPQLVLSLFEKLSCGLNNLTHLLALVHVAGYAQSIHKGLSFQRGKKIH